MDPEDYIYYAQAVELKRSFEFELHTVEAIVEMLKDGTRFDDHYVMPEPEEYTPSCVVGDLGTRWDAASSVDGGPVGKRTATGTFDFTGLPFALGGDERYGAVIEHSDCNPFGMPDPVTWRQSLPTGCDGELELWGTKLSRNSMVWYISAQADENAEDYGKISSIVLTATVQPDGGIRTAFKVEDQDGTQYAVTCVKGSKANDLTVISAKTLITPNHGYAWPLACRGGFGADLWQTQAGALFSFAYASITAVYQSSASKLEDGLEALLNSGHLSLMSLWIDGGYKGIINPVRRIHTLPEIGAVEGQEHVYNLHMLMSELPDAIKDDVEIFSAQYKRDVPPIEVWIRIKVEDGAAADLMGPTSQELFVASLEADEREMPLRVSEDGTVTTVSGIQRPNLSRLLREHRRSLDGGVYTHQDAAAAIAGSSWSPDPGGTSFLEETYQTLLERVLAGVSTPVLRERAGRAKNLLILQGLVNKIRSMYRTGIGDDKPVVIVDVGSSGTLLRDYVLSQGFYYVGIGMEAVNHKSDRCYIARDALVINRDAEGGSSVCSKGGELDAVLEWAFQQSDQVFGYVDTSPDTYSGLSQMNFAVAQHLHERGVCIGAVKFRDCPGTFESLAAYLIRVGAKMARCPVISPGLVQEYMQGRLAGTVLLQDGFFGPALGSKVTGTEFYWTMCEFKTSIVAVRCVDGKLEYSDLAGGPLTAKQAFFWCVKLRWYVLVCVAPELVEFAGRGANRGARNLLVLNHTPAHVMSSIGDMLLDRWLALLVFVTDCENSGMPKEMRQSKRLAVHLGNMARYKVADPAFYERMSNQFFPCPLSLCSVLANDVVVVHLRRWLEVAAAAGCPKHVHELALEVMRMSCEDTVCGLQSKLVDFGAFDMKVAYGVREPLAVGRHVKDDLSRWKELFRKFDRV